MLENSSIVERNSPDLRLIILHQTFIIPHTFSNVYNDFARR